MIRFLLPGVILLMFYFESVFVQFFSLVYFSDMTIVPRFLLLSLFFVNVYYDKKASFIYAVIFGVFYDVYHTTIFGVYLYLLPGLLYLFSKASRGFDTNVVFTSFLSLLGLMIGEFILYAFHLMIQNTSVTFQEFLLERLVPTIVLNAIILLLFSYPFKQFLLWIRKRILDI
ncbi:hypothetical protein Q75_10795 [Bacillus coahuilensis p1.1.43]|uniref:Uncharacterized protein n=1 Tax=Bacillus coahuilensis p1.1.43 TaxID=1150625 RepID=A0A147K730_9BACI|nr:rod shape-determining protein MreD [Bacillus coahuilensis]KUP05866.1 hypothetical protein Q75_10795 [Bacillus coahuilensis p1.1.43]